VHVDPASSPRAWLVLGHGAGRGTDTSDLVHLATALPPLGVTVLRVDQPWVVAGRRVAAPAGHLDACWTEVLSRLRETGELGSPLIVGGRSTGARVACRTAGAVGADAVLLLAFPLRPPSTRKDPAKAETAVAVRLGELCSVGEIPVVVAQGDRDAFGSGDDLLLAVSAAGPPHLEVALVAGADHSLRVGPGPEDQVGDQLVAAACSAVRWAQPA
jgi:predicted alpha/beta-hydrolase family hydrolase